MDRLFIKHRNKVSLVSLDFEREIAEKIYWNERLIGIKGARGVGKTTLLLQRILKSGDTEGKSLYCSLDDIYFSNTSLSELAENFVAYGGENLYLDEVHRYPDWSQELKNLYDDYPQLHIVFTGSSLLSLRDGKGDLSRRAMFYDMPGLSFREFINLKEKMKLKSFSLEEIFQNHVEVAMNLTKLIKPLSLFNDYLQYGYFPFFSEYPFTVQQRIAEIINITIDVDMLQLKGLNTTGLRKLKMLLQIIADSVPFKPNITKLAERTGVNRNTLVAYLKHLDDAEIINNIYSNTHGIGMLQKPEKIYLNNTAYSYTLSANIPDKGNLRETFFLSMCRRNHSLNYTSKGDFLIDNKYVLEVGGKNKTSKQIQNLPDSFITADDIETGFGEKIPLWLFGFLY
ncbi:MAG: AAA family ATPase [Oscillospiraceae bacterium]|jgi:hypothetical protein